MPWGLWAASALRDGQAFNMTAGLAKPICKRNASPPLMQATSGWVLTCMHEPQAHPGFWTDGNYMQLLAPHTFSGTHHVHTICSRSVQDLEHANYLPGRAGHVNPARLVPHATTAHACTIYHSWPPLRAPPSPLHASGTEAPMWPPKPVLTCHRHAAKGTLSVYVHCMCKVRVLCSRRRHPS